MIIIKRMRGSDIVLVILLTLVPISAVQIGCSYMSSSGFYDLKGFAKKDG